MIATIIGRLIIASVAVTNGYVGAQWHIGFPVASRSVWGMCGAYFAMVQRIMLSLVWTSVQSWTGGLCVSVILSAIIPQYQYMANTMPASTHMETKQFVGWVLYNLIQIPFIYLPPEKVRKPYLYFNIISFTTLFCIMIWALAVAGGGGPLLSAPATAQTGSQLGWAIVKAVEAVIGSIAVGLTNQADFCRFARNPGDQVVGQWSAILILGTLMPLFGCVATSAAYAIYGINDTADLWNPPILVSRWLDNYSSGARAGAFFAGCGLLVCQLSINTIDNFYSSGMDCAALVPRYLNIRRGAFLSLIVSVVMCPWQLLSSAGVFISVLSAYSVFLGSWIGLQTCDYWIIRKRQIKLTDLYRPDSSSIYWFTLGINWRAYTAWFIGFAPLLPGFINSITPSIIVPEGCQDLFYMAFPLGYAIAFFVYYCINKAFPPAGLGEIDSVDYYGTFTESEAFKLGVEPRTGINELTGVPFNASVGDADDEKKEAKSVTDSL